MDACCMECVAEISKVLWDAESTFDYVGTPFSRADIMDIPVYSPGDIIIPPLSLSEHEKQERAKMRAAMEQA